jgi:hypothetical protein
VQFQVTRSANPWSWSSPGAALFQPPPSEPCLRLSPHTALQCVMSELGSVVPSVCDLLVAGHTDDQCFPLPGGHDPFPGLLRSPSWSVDVREPPDVVDLDRFTLHPAQLAFTGGQALHDFRSRWIVRIVAALRISRTPTICYPTHLSPFAWASCPVDGFPALGLLRRLRSLGAGAR